MEKLELLKAKVDKARLVKEENEERIRKLILQRIEVTPALGEKALDINVDFVITQYRRKLSFGLSENGESIFGSDFSLYIESYEEGVVTVEFEPLGGMGTFAIDDKRRIEPILVQANVAKNADNFIAAITEDYMYNRSIRMLFDALDEYNSYEQEMSK